MQIASKPPTDRASDPSSDKAPPASPQSIVPSDPPTQILRPSGDRITVTKTALAWAGILFVLGPATWRLDYERSGAWVLVLHTLTFDGPLAILVALLFYYTWRGLRRLDRGGYRTNATKTALAWAGLLLVFGPAIRRLDYQPTWAWVLVVHTLTFGPLAILVALLCYYTWRGLRRLSRGGWCHVRLKAYGPLEISTRRCMFLVLIVACLLGAEGVYKERQAFVRDRRNRHGVMADLCDLELSLFEARAARCRLWEAEEVAWNQTGPLADQLRTCPYGTPRRAPESWQEQAAIWDDAVVRGHPSAARHRRVAWVYRWLFWTGPEPLDWVTSVDRLLLWDAVFDVP